MLVYGSSFNTDGKGSDKWGVWVGVRQVGMCG